MLHGEVAQLLQGGEVVREAVHLGWQGHSTPAGARVPNVVTPGGVFSNLLSTDEYMHVINLRGGTVHLQGARALGMEATDCRNRVWLHISHAC